MLFLRACLIQGTIGLIIVLLCIIALHIGLKSRGVKYVDRVSVINTLLLYLLFCIPAIGFVPPLLMMYATIFYYNDVCIAIIKDVGEGK